MTDKHDYSATLRDTRHRLGLTQAEMAARMRTPLVTYKSWEAGRFAPPGVAMAWCDLATIRRPSGRKETYNHDEMVRRYEAGESTTQIARAMQCDPTTVRSALIVRGVELRPRYGSKGDTVRQTRRQEIVEAYLRGDRVVEIAERHGITPVTVYKNLNMAGFSAPDKSARAMIRKGRTRHAS